MALGGVLVPASALDQLLEEINFQRTKEMRQLLKDESGFVVLQGTTHWTDLFVRHFLFQEERRAIDCDDLLFFVRKRHVRGSSRYLPKYETEVEVFRKDSKKLPVGDPSVDWEETVYLNLVVHQFEYTLTLAVCTRTSPKELQVLRRHSQEVYASPSRRKMDTKGEGEEMTYPHICFMVDNFDEVFCDIVVRDGEMVCVELVARGRGGGATAVIFLGSIRYDALARVYDSRQTSLSTKVAQRMSFGLLGGPSAARCEFVRMRGPAGKGHAELAVSRPRALGADTPASEPGDGDLWDADWGPDADDMFFTRHQRRLSDPSSNIAEFARSGWRAAGDRSRSSDALDALGGAGHEVEGGDLRDGRRVRAASPPVGAAAAGDMRGVCGAPHPAATPDCLRHVTPRRRPHSHWLRPVDDDVIDSCEIALDPDDPRPPPEDAAEERAHSETVRGVEEWPSCAALLSCGQTAAAPARGREDWRTGAARCSRGQTAPPRRVALDGTHIYYWCDVTVRGRRGGNELDDGQYNPLWARRGFSQTFALWKEGRRAMSAPLNAYLTYVTLPWWTIAKDILDHREEPVLTF